MAAPLTPAMAPTGSPRSTWPLAWPSTAPTAVSSSAPWTRPATTVCSTPKVYQMRSPVVATAATKNTPRMVFTRSEPSVGQCLLLRFRQPEAGDDANYVGGRADDRGRIGEPDRHRTARH